MMHELDRRDRQAVAAAAVLNPNAVNINANASANPNKPDVSENEEEGKRAERRRVLMSEAHPRSGTLNWIIG